jgi:hypothetical protein
MCLLPLPRRHVVATQLPSQADDADLTCCCSVSVGSVAVPPLHALGPVGIQVLRSADGMSTDESFLDPNTHQTTYMVTKPEWRHPDLHTGSGSSINCTIEVTSKAGPLTSVMGMVAMGYIDTT